MIVQDLIPSEDQLKRFEIAKLQRPLRMAPLFMAIDDQLISLEVMKRATEGQYPLVTASQAREGLRLYLENAPDILWLDMELPEFSGLQIAEAITAFDPDAYIVMVTSNEVSAQGGNAKRAGAKGFITKPYSKMLVKQTIEKYLKTNPRQTSATAQSS